MPGPRHVLSIRRIAAAVAAFVVVACAAAWIASPNPTSLQSRVRAHLSGTAGRAVPLDRTAPILRQAVVTTEDERFYRHHGIDLVGVARALPYDLAHLTLAQGASTITEQVGKLLYLGGNDHTPWRKLEDAALALKLEFNYPKQQILAAYLDSAYFGDRAVGIDAASERYFGVPPARLTRGQATLLAGLPQAPSAYDPYLHPAAARARQIEVLRSLVRNGLLTETEAAAAISRPLAIRGGEALPPVHGVALAPGPTFAWTELALGAALVVVGALVLVASRLPRLRFRYGVAIAQGFAILIVLLGVATAIRSFRVA